MGESEGVECGESEVRVECELGRVGRNESTQLLTCATTCAHHSGATCWPSCSEGQV